MNIDIPVICGRSLDLPEISPAKKRSQGAEKAQSSEFGARRVELESAGGYEMSLKLLNAGKISAFL